MATGKEDARRERADIKERTAKYGRDPASLRILPGLTVHVGRTAAEADALFEKLHALIPPALAITYLSKVIGFDVSHAELDGPVPAAPPKQALGGTAIGRSVLDMARREGQAKRDLFASIEGCDNRQRRHAALGCLTLVLAEIRADRIA